MATAWSRYFTTPCWARSRFSRTGVVLLLRLHVHRSKIFFRQDWPCCSGTLPQIAADYRISAYFKSQRGVYVNLYVPSTLRWNGRGAQFALRQTTDYPYDSHVRLDLTASSPATFSVFLRIPAWAQDAALAVNGKRDSRKLDAGSFAEVRREWKTGDRIELELPFTTRLEAVDAEHPDVVALINGAAGADGDARHWRGWRP